MKEILLAMFYLPIGVMAVGEGYKYFCIVCERIWK